MNTGETVPAAFVDVHYRLGLALWHAQAFEDTLVYFVALIPKLPPSRAELEMREVLEKLQRRTLASMIAELQRANPTDSVSEFETRIDAFLDERNWLVHASWREHYGDILNADRVPPLRARLDRLAAEASNLQHLFGGLVHRWTPSQGVSQELIDAETRRILAARGAKIR